MRRSFADYAESVLRTLEPPLPLEGRIGTGPLDRWRDIDSTEVTRVQVGQEIVGGAVSDVPLSEEDFRLLDGAVIEGGADALAFYKSIRFRNEPPFREKWGIFIFKFSLDYLLLEIGDYYNGRYESFRAREHAFYYLRDHEMFHFFVDAWSLSVEGISRKSHYETYLNRVYLPMNPGDLVFEEALANAFAFRRSLKRGYSGWLKQFMLDQPGAYAKFSSVDQQTYGHLATQIIYGQGWCFEDPSFEQTPFLNSMPNKIVSDDDCPVYIISRFSPSTLFPAGTGLPQSSEIRDSFLPRYLDARELRRTDHQFVEIDNGETVKVPNTHKGDRLKRAEYNNILHKAGMRKPDFDAARAATRRWKNNCPRPVALPPLP